MTPTERKRAEDRVLKALDGLTEGEKAIAYKQLNASGYSISNCDKRISQSPPSPPDPVAPAPTAQPPDPSPSPYYPWGIFGPVTD